MVFKVKFLYILLIAATLIMAASAFLMIAGLVKESERIENSARDTLIGITSQSDYELQRLVEGLTLFAISSPKISKTGLQTRFDILWSRHNTNTSGKAGEAYLELTGAKGAMDKLLNLLKKSETSLMALKEGDAEGALKLADEFGLLVPILHKVTLAATISTTEITSKLHDHLQNVGFWATIFLPGILVTSFIAGAILWKERHSLNILTKTLESRVQERTQDLKGANNTLKEEIKERKSVEARLVQAQKMEIVGQLTGGVAHDFNNFLAIIQGNAELLKDVLNEHQRNFIKPILRATEKGSELTQRLLAFSRQQPLQPKTLDVSHHVSNMALLFKQTLGESISIEVTFEDEIWGALADPNQLENALLNLIVNSRQAMPDGGHLTIHCSNFPLEKNYIKHYPEATLGDYVVISVSDTGVGIPKDLQEHVFEPFFTTKETGDGSGLGLSMVYGFANQSGGHVNIYSDVGIGTTVKLFLPRGTHANNLYHPMENSRTALSGNGETVLVVEDNEDVRLLAEKILKSLNYEVVIAEDAKNADRVLKANSSIDIILSDVILPGGLSGPDYFETIQRELPNMKVIFMSGYTAEAALENSSIGNDQVLLSKPFQRHRLARALHEALN